MWPQAMKEVGKVHTCSVKADVEYRLNVILPLLLVWKKNRDSHKARFIFRDSKLRTVESDFCCPVAVMHKFASRQAD